MMKRTSVVSVMLVVLAVSGCARAQSGGARKDQIEKAQIPISEAIERGLREAGTGAVIHAELEEHGGAMVYSIDVAQGEKNCNVIVNAADGSIVEKDMENEDHSAEAKAGKIALPRAVESALKRRSGRPVEAELVMEGGKPVVCVRIVADGKTVPVCVDGVSGEVLAANKPGGDEAGAGGEEDEEGNEADKDEEFTKDFPVDAADWANTGTNPWFSLQAGFVQILEGEEDGEQVKLTITVLDETKKVDGVETRVVEEREESGGEVIEISRNYFAISKKTNSVYYFGEDSAEYEDGKVKTRGGSWLSGEKGAKYGLMMPGTPLVGAKYYQEMAPGEAMDRAEIVSLSEKMETPAGKFDHVLKSLETTPLEKGREYKYYAAGVGLLQDGGLKLIKYGVVKK